MEFAVLFIGISTIVALALMYLPEEKITNWMAGKGIFGNVVGAVFGSLTPFCACSTIPIGLALMHKGMSTGAVIALIIGGAGMAIPEMSMLTAIFKKKLVGAVVSVIFFTAVIGGLVFNLI